MSAELTKENASKIAEFLQRYCSEQITELQATDPDAESTDEHVLKVSLSDLAIYDMDLYEDLVEHPGKIRPWFETVVDKYEEVCEAAFQDKKESWDVQLVTYPLPDEVVIEFTDPPSMLKWDIGEPRGEKFNKFVAFEGVCQQTSDPKPRLIEATFECQRCNTWHDVNAENTFELEKAAPIECSNCERKGPFNPITSESEYVEYQQIRVQEPPEDAVNSSNPREILCDAQGKHLVDRVEPGNRVTVVGELVEDQDNDSTLRDDRLEVESVICEETQFEDVEFDDEDIEKIEELADDPEIYDILRQSIAPTIYGFEEEKLGIALQLFGGVSKNIYDNRKRGEIHILFIGDPGVGKTQLLQYARSIAPRAVQSGGTGSTEVGLTATAVKEKIGNEEQWTVQAGSLVLADGGLITIDELDNMRDDQQQALDQALSDGEIDVDKADVHTTLNARCSALMAANPVEGRFNPYDAYPKQFGIPKELLNRCDLVFAPQDQPDPEVDPEIADTVLDSHVEEPASADGGQPMAVDDNGVIDPELLQKYIAYSRRDYRPRLTEEAKEHLKDYYMELRNTLSESDDEGAAQVAINARGLEGLRRLSQAAARVKLSDVVTREHAEKAVQLLQESLNQTAKDPDGEGFDANRLANGARAPSQQKLVDHIEEVVRELMSEHDDKPGAPRDRLVELVINKGHRRQKINHRIDEMKKSGDLYEPQEDYFRWI